MTIAIIGAGIVGLSCADKLSRVGHDIVLLDSQSAEVSLGASTGATRVFRTAYAEASEYVPLAERALFGWRELESRSGKTLFVETGLVEFGSPNGSLMKGSLQSVGKTTRPLVSLTTKELRARYPVFAVADGSVGLFDPSAGILMADAIRSSLLESTKAYGVRVQFGGSVEAIEPTRDRVAISLSSGEQLEADRVVVAAGGWTPAILSGLHLPIQIVRKFYLESEQAGLEPNSCPAFAFEPSDGSSRLWYGLPATEMSPFKVAEHSGGSIAADVGSLERGVTDTEVEELERNARAFIPDYKEGRSTAKVCFYDQTPDGNFLIGQHPTMKNVFLISGTSGHGFKFGPVYGEIVSDWVEGRRSPFLLPVFEIGRSFNGGQQ